jgi:hypothetical protein
MITSRIINSATDTNPPIYTSVGENAITAMVFCNTGTVVDGNENTNAVKLWLHIVSTGSTVGDQFCIVKNLTIPPGETVFFDTERLVLGNGQFISGRLLATNGDGSITATISTLAV